MGIALTNNKQGALYVASCCGENAVMVCGLAKIDNFTHALLR
jgi:hypothetical protein